MTEPPYPDDGPPRTPDDSQEQGGVLASDRSASSATYEPAPADRPAVGRAGRFWSGRRIPAAIAALLIFGGSGLLLYDVSAVRADHPAMRWRRSLAEELATRPLNDVWILTGAAVATALGLWLLLLALTPGLRALLPMRRTRPGVRAGLDRNAAAMVLRDRAVEVPGVQSVRVRVRRSKVAVKAASHFRELDEVRGDLDAALGRGIRELGLARQPRPSVRVRRPAKKG